MIDTEHPDKTAALKVIQLHCSLLVRLVADGLNDAVIRFDDQFFDAFITVCPDLDEAVVSILLASLKLDDSVRVAAFANQFRPPEVIALKPTKLESNQVPWLPAGKTELYSV